MFWLNNTLREMKNIEELIQTEENKLTENRSANELANIYYNLICLRHNTGSKNDTYKNIKRFFDNYIESIKGENYGYDNFNYQKIINLLDLLKLNEQIAILQYAISTTARELPEHDRNWFISKKHEIEIRDILTNRKISQFPKAFLLYCSHSVRRLLITLLAFFLLVYVVLLPAQSSEVVLFIIKYESYSSNFTLNHLLNVISLFSDLDNNLKVTPIGLTGLIIAVIGKIFFVALIVNFIYIKISDKIALK